MPKHASATLKAKARRALWSHAFFRTESALTIAGTLILLVLAVRGTAWLPGSWQLWLGFGIIAELILVLITVSDQASLQKITDQLFEEQFDLKTLRQKSLREKVVKALEYRRQIVKEISRKETTLDNQLYGVAQKLEDWVAQIYHLAQSLDTYLHDGVIARDLEQVPKELEGLNYQLRRQQSEALQAQLKQSLQAKNQQWRALNALRDTMQSAQLQLDTTLSAMSTVYSQTIHLNAKDLKAGQAQDLAKEMQEQIQSLEDISSAVDEVYKLSGTQP